MRIGIAGLGFGANLLNTLLLREDCTVAAVADHFEARRGFAKARGIPCYDDGAAMVREAALDAVVIASAPHVRAPVLDAALEAELPVFMEKPLAGTVAQAEEIAARCKGRLVMLGFSFRFHAPVRALAERLKSGALGTPRLLNGSYVFDWLPDGDGWLWRPDQGGGFFTENSCHLFDVVTTLMGRPTRVFAEGVNDGLRPSATGAAVTLRFENGGTAALSVGGIGTGGHEDFPRIELMCSGGQAHLTGRQHMWTGLRWGARGGEIHAMSHEPESLHRSRYSEAFDHFIARAKDGGDFDATPEDGVQAVRIAAAIYRAIDSGQAQDI